MTKTVTHLILVLLFTTGLSGKLAAQTFEAEDATYSDGLIVETALAGYSGSGYVGNFANDNDLLSFHLSLDKAGYYDLTLGYAAPLGEKTNNISINGNRSECTVAESHSFQEKTMGKVRLKQGDNVIEITKSWGWFYVDYLKVTVNNDPQTTFNLPELVTPHASENTLKLYAFLKDHFQKKVISGVMTLNSFDESDWLKEQTGKEPALLGLDFLHCNRNYSWYDDYTPVNDAKTWYNKNGIPAISWHWRDPSRETEAFYTDETSFDVSKIDDETSPEYQAMLNDIDYIAGLLKELATDHIPILWRPLHEASGGWFWWGAHGPDACKKLWRVLFDRLVNHHQLNNLIWVWTTDNREDNLDWYPGDEYVDILGVDIYAEAGDFGSQYLTFDQLKNDFEGRKMITLSECGIVPDPDRLVEDQAGWSWFMPWYGDFVRSADYNPLSHWEAVLNHAYVITLDEMPNLREYVTSSRSVEVEPNDAFQLYIDPARQLLRINPANQHERYDVSIFNATGCCLFTQCQLAAAQEIPVGVFPRGLLVVRLETSSAPVAYKLINR